MVIYKIRILCLLLISLHHNCYSQLNLNQLANIQFGENFIVSKNTIQSMFLKKGIIEKGDFLNTYQINFDSTSFDYYGNGNYSFQYAKDILISAKVIFNFLTWDTIKFRRLYNAFMHDILGDPSKKLLIKYSTLNSKLIFPYVSKNCIISGKDSAIGYKPIKKKNLGQNVWALYTNQAYSGKLLRMNIGLGEIHTWGGEKEEYDGGEITVEFLIIDERFKDLYDQVEFLETINYSNIF